MSWTVAIAKPALKEIAALLHAIQVKVLHTLRHYAATGEGDVKHLAGRANQWRLRVGDYRIVFELGTDAITVKRIAHRREVYR